MREERGSEGQQTSILFVFLLFMLFCLSCACVCVYVRFAGVICLLSAFVPFFFFHAATTTTFISHLFLFFSFPLLVSTCPSISLLPLLSPLCLSVLRHPVFPPFVYLLHSPLPSVSTPLPPSPPPPRQTPKTTKQPPQPPQPTALNKLRHGHCLVPARRDCTPGSQQPRHSGCRCMPTGTFQIHIATTTPTPATKAKPFSTIFLYGQVNKGVTIDPILTFLLLCFLFSYST